MSQASRRLSAIAELLVYFCNCRAVLFSVSEASCFVCCCFADSTYRAFVHFLLPSACFRINHQSEHSNCMDLEPDFFARTVVLLPSKRCRRPCEGEIMKVKFVYNRLTDENGVRGRPNQISHHLQKSTCRA